MFIFRLSCFNIIENAGKENNAGSRKPVWDEVLSGDCFQ